MDRLSKKQSELYIGCTNLDWEYIEVPYTADCTVALPLSFMDKVICGLLSIDGELSALQLGEILGLNVDNSHKDGKYRDMAEDCLLDMAIGSLLEYGMIKRKKSGLFCLTDIGKEYYAKGRKFRTDESSSFTVYYDRKTSNHGKLGRILSGLEGERTAIRTPKRFKDESFLKSFIHQQIPFVYDEKIGNSFTNISCPDMVEVVKASIQIAVLYDVITEGFRFKAIVAGEVCEELSGIIAARESVCDELLRKIGGMLDGSVMDEDRLSQERFEMTLTENPFSVVEPVTFWKKLDEIVGQKEKEVFVNVDLLDGESCEAIVALCRKRPLVNVFLSYGECEVEIPFVKNLFHVGRKLGEDYILSVTDATYAVKGYVITYKGEKLHANMVFQYAHVPVDLSFRRKLFAQEALPEMIAQVLEYLAGDIPFAKSSLEAIASCDIRLGVFGDLVDEKTKELIAQKKLEAAMKLEQELIEEMEEREKGEIFAGKTYVIDTNVFLDDPEILDKFRDEDRVIVPEQVLNELDAKKLVKNNSVLSANARKAVRAIDNAKTKGRFSEKKSLEVICADMSLLGREFREDKGDNYILGVAIKYVGKNVVLLTSDKIFRLRAEPLGIPVVSLEEFYEMNKEELKIGDVVTAKVKKIAKYGFHATFGEGLVGFVHNSELCHHINNFKEPGLLVKVGQTVKVKVLSIAWDEEKGKQLIGLSYKEACEDPWKSLQVKEGDIVVGTVYNVLDYGLFVLYKGLSIFVHRSALPLSDGGGAVSPVKEFAKVGDILKVEIMQVGIEERKILGTFAGKSE
ncbi:MAG: S1 RNA-binding domain-containing protein [Bacteroidales bacterium]|nr:S1 RNA-binding domain-containing protein [Bacteroidales bacterium]